MSHYRAICRKAWSLNLHTTHAAGGSSLLVSSSKGYGKDQYFDRDAEAKMLEYLNEINAEYQYEPEHLTSITVTKPGR